MPGPNMEVIWVKEEAWLSISVSPCRNFELHIIVRYIFLLVIHSKGLRLGDMLAISNDA